MVEDGTCAEMGYTSTTCLDVSPCAPFEIMHEWGKLWHAFDLTLIPLEANRAVSSSQPPVFAIPFGYRISLKNKFMQWHLHVMFVSFSWINVMREDHNLTVSPISI